MTIVESVHDAVIETVDRRVDDSVRKSVPNVVPGVYKGRDGQGKDWVLLEGAKATIPVKLMSVQADVGDTVSVTIENGTATIDANVSNPSASASNVGRVESIANDAAEDAQSAVTFAQEAQGAASAAQASATAAGNAALNAQASADRAQEGADTANRAAGEAVRDASVARESAEAALDDAAEAKVAAHAATFALSDVERVVGTLNWIAEHGTYSPTGDEEVVDGKVYYARSGDGSESDPYSYEPVADPSAEGLASYYELELGESVQSYLAAHLWLDDYGLNLSVDSAAGYRIHQGTFDGRKPAGTYIVDPNGYVVASFGADGTRVGRDDGPHVEITDNSVKLGYADKLPFEVTLPEYVYSLDDEWQELGQIAPYDENGKPRKSGYLPISVPASGSKGYDLSTVVDADIAYLSATLEPYAEWIGLTAQAPDTDPYPGAEGPVTIVTDSAMPPVVSSLPSGISYDPVTKTLTVENAGDCAEAMSQAEAMAEQANLELGEEGYGPAVDVIIRFKRVAAMSVEQDGDTLAVHVAGRGTMPVYRYETAPAYQDIPAAPSLALDDKQAIWVYEGMERKALGYLPLTGGTLTGHLQGTTASFSSTLEAGGQVSASKFRGKAESTSWVNAAKVPTAPFYAPKAEANGWCPTVAVDTYGGGTWSIGNYNNENLIFSYVPKAIKDAGTNAGTNVVMPNTAGTLALTSQITAAQAGALPLSGGTLTGNLQMGTSSNGNKIIRSYASNFAIDIAPSAAVYHQPLEVYDSKGTLYGHEEWMLQPDKSVGHRFAAVRQYVNGTLLWRQCTMFVDTAGNATYNIPSPANFRNALGASSGKWTAAQVPNIESLTNFASRVYDATASRTANTVLAAPNGSNGAASFRKLVEADIPSLNASKITAGTLAVARGGTGSTGFGTYTSSGSGTVSCPNNTPTNVWSQSLAAGTWLVCAGLNFAAGTSGVRYLHVTTTSKNGDNERVASIRQNATSGGAAMLSCANIVNLSATTTVYLVASQSNGGALNVTGWMQSFRLK